MPSTSTHINRRRLFSRGAGAALGVAAAAGLDDGTALAQVTAAPHVRRQQGHLPVQAIERAVQAEGDVTDGVLTIDVSRDDIGTVRGPDGVTFDGSFEIDGSARKCGHHANVDLGDNRDYGDGRSALEGILQFADVVLRLLQQWAKSLRDVR